MRPFIEGEKVFHEELALKGTIAIYFQSVGDVNHFLTDDLIYEEILRILKEKLTRSLPQKHKAKIGQYAREILNFSYDMEIGDFVITPVSEEKTCYVGIIVSGYFWNSEVKCHMRMVDWQKISRIHLTEQLRKELEVRGHTIRLINEFLPEVGSIYYRYK